jgi:starvation-inducible DNA-binding protein
MTNLQAFSEPVQFDEKTKTELVALLNQSLADTLDLAYQTKQAHWNVKGYNFHGLHLLFDDLHGQLAGYVDDFASRAVSIGGQALGTIRMAGSASRIVEYPLEALTSRVHVDALVDRYGEYTGHMRKASRKAEQLGDQYTADLHAYVHHAIDKALWMLTAHHEA